MDQHVRTLRGRSTFRYLFLLVCLFGPLYTRTDNHPVYRLTIQVSGARFNAFDDDLCVELYSNRGNGTHTSLSHLRRNETRRVTLMSNSTSDIGPICKIKLKLNFTGDGAKKLILDKFSVTHIAKNDVGIFIPNTVQQKNVSVWSKVKSLSRYDTQWEAWGDCSCDTPKRSRRRYVPDCGGKAKTESHSELCQSISEICDSQKTYIIVGSVLGFIIILLAVVVSLWCIKKHPQSAPTINIKMIPKDNAPVALLRPELGSTLRLEMIQHGDSALTPQPEHRMMVPRYTPKVKLLEEEYLEEIYAPGSVLSSLQSLPYEELYSRPRECGQLSMPATTAR